MGGFFSLLRGKLDIEFFFFVNVNGSCMFNFFSGLELMFVYELVLLGFLGFYFLKVLLVWIIVNFFGYFKVILVIVVGSGF